MHSTRCLDLRRGSLVVCCVCDAWDRNRHGSLDLYGVEPYNISTPTVALEESDEDNVG